MYIGALPIGKFGTVTYFYAYQAATARLTAALEAPLKNHPQLATAHQAVDTARAKVTAADQAIETAEPTAGKAPSPFHVPPIKIKLDDVRASWLAGYAATGWLLRVASGETDLATLGSH